MKSLFFGLFFPAVLLAQSFKTDSSPINRKIDLSASALPSSTGITFWLGRTAYHGAFVSRATVDGSRVTITTNEGPLDLEWSKLPAEARGKLGAGYETAVAQANLEAQRAIAAEKAASEAAAGIFTVRSAKVVSVSPGGILVDLPGEDRRVFLKGYPQGNVADDDEISFKGSNDGVYKYFIIGGGSSTVHALKYLGPPSD